MFFLVMQFLWKYVDDLMGKGLEWYVVAELLFYASANLVPMALPIAILLSSIMTFGNLAESNELTAMKSAGLSLTRIMRPLTVFIFLISIGAFFFSNYTWPVANLKFRALINDIQEQKPTLALNPGTFYNDIPGYSIYAKEKNNSDESFKEIFIFDQSHPNALLKRDLYAEQGQLLKTDNGDHLYFTLIDGRIYQEMDPSSVKNAKYPFMKMSFKEGVLHFDMEAFKLQRTDVDVFRSHFEMMNMEQLEIAEDSLRSHLAQRREDFSKFITNEFMIYRPVQVRQADSSSLVPTAFLWKNLEKKEKANAVSVALTKAREINRVYTGLKDEVRGRNEYINKHRIEWHRKLTLSFACVILFFIGAPLGAIIRKGGLGAPMVASVLLFIFFYIVSISGEKMAKSEVMDPFWGMWLSTFVLAPFSFLLTWSSNRDSKLFTKDFYISKFRFLRRRKS